MYMFGGSENHLFFVFHFPFSIFCFSLFIFCFSFFDMYTFDPRSDERRASNAQRPGRGKFTAQAFHAVSATAAQRLEQNAARENDSVPRRQRSIR